MRQLHIDVVIFDNLLVCSTGCILVLEILSAPKQHKRCSLSVGENDLSYT